MAAYTLVRPLRAFLLPAFLLLAALGFGQVDNVYVYGTVKDYVSSKKLDGITVTVFKNGGKLAEVVTSASGKYEFNLDYGSDYKITYSKPGMVAKNIAIDTRNIPEEERVGGHGMNVEMTLFAELPGIDFSVLNQPIGKAKFDGATKEVTWDLQYTEQVRAEIARLMKEYDEKKKREANAEEEFLKLMAQGDASMGAGDYKKAVESFTGALALKPADPKAKAKLSDAQMKLDELEGNKKEAEKYAALIKEADAFFAKKDYTNAKAKYQGASEVKETEAYPKQKMKECQAFIDELAKQAEAEKKAKELEEKYKAALAAADAAFKAEKLEDAQARYTDASGIKPEEKYPKDQLALIAKKLEEKAKREEEEKKKKELDAKYQALITAADAAFKASNYESAKTKYNDALGVKPEEKYPKDQIAAIDKKLAELEKQAEEQRKQKELDDQYKAAIAKGDAAFKKDAFDEAKAGYNEALGLKPKEKYPTDQLAAIDRRIAELAKKAEEEKKKKELDDAYNAVLAEADGAFKGSQWDVAKEKYNAALKLKAQERYPKDQLLAIDKAIADAAKKAAEEARQKEIDEMYELLIGSADGLFAQDKLEAAKAKFQEASGVKPDQKYPKTKITEIDALLAQRLKEAEEGRKRKELDDKYNALIAKADKSYDGKKYGEALNDYKDALQLKPDEQHPKDRIADIQGRMDAEAQARAEKERLERELKELEARYNGFITAGDNAFKAKKYDDAKRSYTDALGMRPDEKYPKNRIEEIDRLLAELASKDEAARLKAEQDAAERARLDEERRRKEAEAAAIEARYQEAITKGDLAITAERFDDARERFTEALAIKPNEKYPKERLETIEKMLADRERAKLSNDEAEAERRRLEEERRKKAEADAEAARLAAEAERDRLAGDKAKRELYDKAVAEADAAMSDERYEDARSGFMQALDILPDETYPKAKLDQIEQLLAEAERRRREAELAAQKKEEPENTSRKASTIDMGKEDDAVRFMREAREREEAEKWERIKKLRADLGQEEQANSGEAYTRREQALQVKAGYVEKGASMYEGSDQWRQKREEELAAQRAAWEQRQRDVVARADQNRDGAYTANVAIEEQREESAATWQGRHAERVESGQADKGQWAQKQEDLVTAGQARSDRALEDVERIEENQGQLHARGSTVGDDLENRVASDKDRIANQQRLMANRSEDERMAAREQLSNLPGGKQRSFSDYNRGQLANEYPQGVTEESLTEGNYVIIRRIVVQGNKADEFKKVIGKAGTSYFRNGLSTTEWVWRKETEE